MNILSFLHSLSDIIIAFGYIGVFFAIFLESGVPIGFFLPGDSLLFTLGLLASQHVFDIKILTPLVISAAILGDSVGYSFGKFVGNKLHDKNDTWYFKKEYLNKTEEFFNKHGKKAIIFARFMPVVRTFTPIMAGAGKMQYPTFFLYNVIGGIIWGTGFTLLGYFLGTFIPGIDKYFSYIVIAIIVISFSPIISEMYKNKKSRAIRLSQDSES